MKRSPVRRRTPPDAVAVDRFREQVLDRAAGRCEIGPILCQAAADYDDDPEARAMFLDACRACRGVATQAHHRQPRGMGGHGNNNPSNGLATCEPCHRWTESHRKIGYALGLLLRH